MLNIVIPMAGAGSRFADAGYIDPKPLISVDGMPMIRIVINNLRPAVEHRFIFICQEDHVESYGLREKLSEWAPGSEVVTIDGLTEGAACSVLAARSLIANDDPLMIANSDQYIDVNINDYLKVADDPSCDGLIMTMTASDPKWSFLRYDKNLYVLELAEKKVISDEATVGVYNFRHGIDFVRAAESMIAQNLRVNNEFYVAPAYNELIRDNRKIRFFNVGSERSGMYGLGIPDDLKFFVKSLNQIKLYRRPE